MLEIHLVIVPWTHGSWMVFIFSFTRTLSEKELSQKYQTQIQKTSKETNTHAKTMTCIINTDTSFFKLFVFPPVFPFGQNQAPLAPEVSSSEVLGSCCRVATACGATSTSCCWEIPAPPRVRSGGGSGSGKVGVESKGRKTQEKGF